MEDIYKKSTIARLYREVDKLSGIDFVQFGDVSDVLIGAIDAQIKLLLKNVIAKICDIELEEVTDEYVEAVSMPIPAGKMNEDGKQWNGFRFYTDDEVRERLALLIKRDRELRAKIKKGMAETMPKKREDKIKALHEKYWDVVGRGLSEEDASAQTRQLILEAKGVIAKLVGVDPSEVNDATAVFFIRGEKVEDMNNGRMVMRYAPYTEEQVKYLYSSFNFNLDDFKKQKPQTRVTPIMNEEDIIRRLKGASIDATNKKKSIDEILYDIMSNIHFETTLAATNEKDAFSRKVAEVMKGVKFKSPELARQNEALPPVSEDNIIARLRSMQKDKKAKKELYQILEDVMSNVHFETAILAQTKEQREELARRLEEVMKNIHFATLDYNDKKASIEQIMHSAMKDVHFQTPDFVARVSSIPVIREEDIIRNLSVKKKPTSSAEDLDKMIEDLMGNIYFETPNYVKAERQKEVLARCLAKVMSDVHFSTLDYETRKERVAQMLEDIMESIEFETPSYVSQEVTGIAYVK